MVLYPHGKLLHRYQSPVGRRVGRVRDLKQLSLTKPDCPLVDISVSLSVLRVALFLPNSHSIGWFPFSWRKLIPLKDGWAMTSLSNWRCLRSVWTAVGTIVAKKVFSIESNLDEHTCSHCFPYRCPSVGLAECLAIHWSDCKTSSASVTRFQFLPCNSTATWTLDVALPQVRCNQFQQI